MLTRTLWCDSLQGAGRRCTKGIDCTIAVFFDYFK
jgi:hypothetical protein